MKRQRQSGFTLVELLVVIGIIGALAAVVVPNLARFSPSADGAAQSDELYRIQLAMDTYIAEAKLSPATVTENTTPSNNFATSDPALYPDYLRDPNSRCLYTWTDTGLVSTASCP